MDVAFNPQGFNKPGLMKYRVGKVAVLKSTANKSCRPENSFLQTALCKLSINENGRWKADKEVVFLFKPAGLPPGTAKGNFTKTGFSEPAVVECR
ncbi:hypothetical protein SCALIN_C28_0208 [Candidatus Scalindua japonica]|uniref:Uncharacterized protein n=1 Tax=Candidatus Scalindua japonica TaxID=1284222 RepID=A0A286U1L0_9BACT|nr:hypothetical protein SCALIN_C28_0208 [Candidatus Scalindua japonica]